MSTLTIFIPSAGQPHPDLAFVARGSAIVGQVNGAGIAMIDFEGDIRNAHAGNPTLPFAEKLRLATARHVSRIPTSARFHDIPQEHLRKVGTCDSNGRVIEITAREALDDWTAAT